MIRIIAILIALSMVALPATAAHNKRDKLPPGLQKKVERGGELPPGWQKKLAVGDVLDRETYNRGRVAVPVGSDGTITIEVEGTFIKLDDTTRKIIKIMDVLIND